MANKMLIDATHPEETRVVVVRGNRVEEFDFEAANRRPLRGNIYLAKVTRVEPSLQAAFVDYGGNRHGFLAFGEIHPDYYQLPIAERLVWSHDFAHVEWIYNEWAPDYRPSAAVLDDIKATLRAPGGIEGALGYYWSLFGDAGGDARAAIDLAMPALVIAGASDGAVGRERYEAARAAFTGPYEYAELAGVGHFPQLEAPDRVADTILNFLRFAGQ